MNKMILGAAAAAMAVVAAAPANAATSVFNENFETGFGKFTPSGNVERIKGAAYTTGGNTFTGSAAAQDNTYAAFGSGDESPVGGTLLAATINGPANVSTMYRLSFAAGVIGTNIASQFLNVTITNVDGQVLKQKIALTGSTNLDNALKDYTFDFTTSGPISFSFFGEGLRGDGADTLLDNITVTAGVPEMSTWGMMIVGFGVVGGSLRTRRRKVVFAA